MSSFELFWAKRTPYSFKGQLQKRWGTNTTKIIPGSCIREKSAKEVFEKWMNIFNTQEQNKQTNKQSQDMQIMSLYIQPRYTAQGLSPRAHTCVSDLVQ